MVPRPTSAVVACSRMHEHLDFRVALRAIGEWFDITHALESVPQAVAVFGISGLLLDQLADLTQQLWRSQRTGQAPQGALLAGLACQELLAAPATRREVVSGCRLALAHGEIAAHPALAGLDAELRRSAGRRACPEELARDYLIWTHLAFMSSALREGDPRVAPLARQARGFGADDGRQLLAAIADAVASLTPRWRRLLGNGQIEIAALAYSDAPIGSWLGARAAAEYPGGSDRARWQIARTLQAMVGAFGVRPRSFLGSPERPAPALAEMLHSFALTWVAAPQPGKLRRRAGRVQRQLIEAKRVFDQVVVEGNLSEERQRAAEFELARCECAQWLGGGDGAAYASRLAGLYRVLGEAPPEDLPAAAARAA